MPPPRSSVAGVAAVYLNWPRVVMGWVMEKDVAGAVSAVAAEPAESGSVSSVKLAEGSVRGARPVAAL